MDHPFRTAVFGGFQREDVLNYLAEQARQGQQQREELEEKKRFVLAFKTEMPLSRQLEKYSEHMELLRKQSERLKHVKEKLEERIEERRHE